MENCSKIHAALSDQERATIEGYDQATIDEFFRSRRVICMSVPKLFGGFSEKVVWVKGAHQNEPLVEESSASLAEGGN